MKSYKNVMLIHSLERAIDSMCYGLGTRRVKTFLNCLVKSGDDVAYLLRELLGCETLNINAKRYNNTMRFDYRESYYAKKSERLNNLLRNLVKSNPCNVVIGYDSSDVSDTSNIVYFEHDLFSQISFHCDIDYDLLSVIHKFNGKWDGLVNSTLNKLEKAVEKQYGEALDKKYTDIRDGYRERIRLAKIHEQKINEIHRLLNEDFVNVYKLDDFTDSEHSDAGCCYSNKDKLTKFVLGELGFDVNSYLNKEEIILKLNCCNKRYLRYYVSFDIVERLRNSFRSKKVSEIRSLLNDDLNNLFSLSGYLFEFHKTAYRNMKDRMKDDIALKIINRYYNEYDLSSGLESCYKAICNKFDEEGMGYLSVYFSYNKLCKNITQVHVLELRNFVRMIVDANYDLSVLSSEQLMSLYSAYGKPGSRYIFGNNIRKILIPKLKSMFEKKEK